MINNFKWTTPSGANVELRTRTYDTTINDGWGNKIKTGEGVLIESCVVNGSMELKNTSFNGMHDRIEGRLNGKRALVAVPEEVYNVLFAERDAAKMAAYEASYKIDREISERDEKMKKHGFGE